MAWGLSTIHSWGLKIMALGKELSPLAGYWHSKPILLTHDEMLARQAQEALAQEAQLLSQQIYARQQDMRQANYSGGLDAQGYQLPIPPPTLTPHAKALHLLKLRLAGLDSKFNMGPEDFLCCHVHSTTVYVFFLFDGKSGVTQEESALFPSDKLITQLRMIR